jgi:3' terminal RNA ribose 2'-O-methyltransferase Hen1
MSFGEGYVYFQENPQGDNSLSLLVDVDPLATVQGRGQLSHMDGLYVNDRAYVPSSLLTSALTKAFGTALSGRCKERPELASTPIDWTVSVPVVTSDWRTEILWSLFGPLGYEVRMAHVEREGHRSSHPDVASDLTGVKLCTTATMREVLSHLVVLIQVLDQDNHRWLDEQDLDPFMRRVEGWLPEHPYGMFILKRALKHQKHLIKAVIAKFPAIVDSQARISSINSEMWDASQLEEYADQPLSLNRQRFAVVQELIERLQPRSLVDLGCGDGSFIGFLANGALLHPMERIIGMDVSASELARAKTRMEHLSSLPGRRTPVEWLLGSLLYRDPRIKGLDMAILIEVIEHIDPWRLPALERQVFGEGGYASIVVTTPNREFNLIYGLSEEHSLRHRDHRFEWTRQEFQEWVQKIASQYGYEWQIQGIGTVSLDHGSPSQMVLFQKSKGA